MCGYGDIGKFCVSPSVVLVIVVNPSGVDNKEFVFPGIAAFECQTDHMTTGLVSARPLSEALASTSLDRPVLCGVYGVMDSAVTRPS